MIFLVKLFLKKKIKEEFSGEILLRPFQCLMSLVYQYDYHLFLLHFAFSNIIWTFISKLKQKKHS